MIFESQCPDLVLAGAALIWQGSKTIRNYDRICASRDACFVQKATWPDWLNGHSIL